MGTALVMEHANAMAQMVTHDTSLAKYGTRVVRVEDGRIIEKGKEILK